MSIWKYLITTVKNHKKLLNRSGKERTFREIFKRQNFQEIKTQDVKKEVKKKIDRDTQPGNLAKKYRECYFTILKDFLTSENIEKYKKKKRNKDPYRKLYAKVRGMKYSRRMFQGALNAELHDTGFRNLLVSHGELFFPMSSSTTENDNSIQIWNPFPNFADIIAYNNENFRQTSKASENILNKINDLSMLSSKRQKTAIQESLEDHRNYIVKEANFPEMECPVCGFTPKVRKEEEEKTIDVFDHFVEEHIKKIKKSFTPSPTSEVKEKVEEVVA